MRRRPEPGRVRWAGARRRLVAAAMGCGAVAANRPARAQSDVVDSAYMAAEAGAWEPSAVAWRHALDRSPTLAGAAAYTLRAAPQEAHAAVQRAFLAPPPSRGARIALAQLETGWGDARSAWAALSALPPGDSTASAWIDFADGASSSAPLVARDAYAAALAVHPSVEVTARAADAALAGGDPASALALVDRAAGARAAGDSSDPAIALLPQRVRALTRLGRMGEAEELVSRAPAARIAGTRAGMGHDITWGYVRAGNIAAARAAAGRFGMAGDSEVVGWLALYAGDLRAARQALQHADGLTTDALTALALLARTSVDSARAVGDAFVLLARGDTVAAADRFVAASAVVRDAAPLLLATAARLHAAQHRDGLAIPLWRTVVEHYASAPEAPEADLEWGRALRRTADTPGAIARWEHLILTYPESALVPLARRELEAAKATA